MADEGSASLDQTLEAILARFSSTHRLDRAQEELREALRQQLVARGIDAPMLRLLEVNLLGSLSGWIAYILEEQQDGKNVVPDFARLLKEAFVFHCREKKIPAEEGMQMLLQLATAMMDLAAGLRETLSEDKEQPEPATAR